MSHPEIDPSIRKFRLFLTAVTVYLFVFFSLADVWNYLGLDFGLFHEAAGQLWKGESPYDRIFEAAQEDDSEAIVPWGHYIYPTPYAAHLMPFLLFPVLWAKRIHTGLVMILYCVGWLFYRKWMPGQTRPWIGLAALALWLLWEPSVTTFRHGQSNSLVFLFLLGGWMALKSQHRITAGLLIGFAISIKLTAVLILPLLFVGGNRKVTAWAAVGFLLPCFLLFPGENLLYFTRVLPAMSNYQEIDGLRNLEAFFLEWTQTPRGIHIWPILLNGALYSGLVLFFYFQRHRYKPEAILLVGMLLTPVFSGEHSHHYMMAVLPACHLLAAALDRVTDRKNAWLPGMIAVLLFPAWYYYLPCGQLMMGSIVSLFGLEAGLLLAPGLLVAGLLGLSCGLFRDNSRPKEAIGTQKGPFDENPSTSP